MFLTRRLTPGGGYIVDEVITKKVKDTPELIDIKLLDHFIICEEGYYSFAEQGEL
ncbi:MAG TPA: JAB domain-containing protein [Ferruginibacter sp.]|nr:JAB domain-containing protein [Ferruginibacter sp.]